MRIQDDLLAKASLPRATLQSMGTAAGLLFLRLSASFMLFYVHGWPKVVHFSQELTRIEDPFGWGARTSLLSAIAAEVICPLFIAAGLFTRLATLPILVVLVVALLVVHAAWSIAEGQFGWLLLICFATLALCGAGDWSLDAHLARRQGASS